MIPGSEPMALMQPMVDHLPLDAAHLHPITSDEAGQAGIDDVIHEKRPHQIIAILRKWP